MRSRRSPKKFSLDIKSLLVLLFLFIVFIVGFYIFETHFSIKKIIVVSEGKQNSFRGVSSLKGHNLVFLSNKKTEELLYSNNPFIKKITIHKEYPSSLRLKIEYSKEIAVIKADDGYFIIDKAGKILGKTKTMKSNIPVINYYQKLNYINYSAGELIAYLDITTALTFLDFTRQLGYYPHAIDITGLNMIAFNLDKKKILFTTDKDIELQKYQVETIIKQLKIRGEEFRTLDVRFDKPVITF